MQTEHRLFGAAAWSGLTLHLGLPTTVVLGGATLAALTSGGITSPDVDQYKVFKTIFRWWPGKFDDYIFGHRRIAHWWGLPAIAALALYVAGGSWPLWALIFGWSSHLVADLVFGKRVWKENIPAGIPVFPWWFHVGGLFRSHGLVASIAAYGSAAGAMYLVMT